MYINFRLDKSMTLSDLEYEGATVGYGQLSCLLVLTFLLSNKWKSSVESLHLLSGNQSVFTRLRDGSSV